MQCDMICAEPHGCAAWAARTHGTAFSPIKVYVNEDMKNMNSAAQTLAFHSVLQDSIKA